MGFHRIFIHLVLYSSLAASMATASWSPTSLLVERLSTPILRRIWRNPSVTEENSYGNRTDIALRRQSPVGGVSLPPPKLELIDMETYCFGNIDFVQLGPCSSTYLKCLGFSEERQFELEECPLGKVFHGTECKSAYQVHDCFNSEVNALNDATEKLAQATAFCSRSPFVSALYTLAENDAMEDVKCTRQALLCRLSGVPQAISCPPEKVLDVAKLECVEAPDHCWFISPGTFTPIKESLMQGYCEVGGNEQSVSMEAPVASRQLSWGTRCQNWYVTCDTPQPLEMVFCDQGKLFDHERRTCRRIQPEDQCPHVSTCHGWEWRTVALGECRTDFLYCNAMRPLLFQCMDNQKVFKDGRCVSTSAAELEEKCSSTLCRLGEKRVAEKCNEFSLCQNRTGVAGLATGGAYWQSYRCIAERVYSPVAGACVPPTEYQCPLRKESCEEGHSYSIECGSFFYCHDGRWMWGRCPDGTKWAAEHKRCLVDASCRQLSNGGVAGMVCQNGEARPSVDCRSYEECVNGQYVKQPCLDYSTNRFKPACRFCSAKQLESEQSGQYTVDSLLPANFNPFDQQGIRQRQCSEREKIVNKHDCSRYMECLNGEWFNFACPAGYHFDPTSESCRVGGGCQGVKPSGNYSSVYMHPLYNRTNSIVGTNTLAESAPPPQIPTDLRQNYNGYFTFCDQNSVRRLGHPHDCSRFRECELQLGGYYVDKQCPFGSFFDPKRGECSYEYSCPTNVKCVEGVREPRQGCGQARRCRAGEWENIHCRDNMAFINGRCSTTVSCPKSNTNYPHGTQCFHGQTRAHHQDCSKYLLCQFGQFVEERCHSGHKFNPDSGRCDPSYSQCTSSYQPTCYEGEMRPYPQAARKSLAGRNATRDCDLYSVCIDEKWESQRCPYANRFNREKSRCEPGYCTGEAGVDDSMAKDGEEEAEAAKPRHGVKCGESAAADGFRADGENCGRFYQCASGKWVSKECPANTVFNSMIGVCDWPANVPGC